MFELPDRLVHERALLPQVAECRGARTLRATASVTFSRTLFGSRSPCAAVFGHEREPDPGVQRLPRAARCARAPVDLDPAPGRADPKSARKSSSWP